MVIGSGFSPTISFLEPDEAAIHQYPPLQSSPPVTGFNTGYICIQFCKVYLGSCAQLCSLAETRNYPLQHLGSLTRALLVSKRRHLFVTPWVYNSLLFLQYYDFAMSRKTSTNEFTDSGLPCKRLKAQTIMVFLWIITIFYRSPNAKSKFLNQQKIYIQISKALPSEIKCST